MYKAKLSYYRSSARKARLVADLVRGKKVDEAQAILKFTKNKVAEPMLKLLNSAEANAKNLGNNGELYISKILVNEGPTHKRIMPRAKGSAYRIRKRTSHIEIEIDQIKEEKKVKKNKTKKNES